MWIDNDNLYDDNDDNGYHDNHVDNYLYDDPCRKL